MSSENLHAKRSAATRRKLIDAAATLFAEHGYGHVGTEQIVRAAGVTRGAMYHQFADKSELLAAIVEELDTRLAATIGERTLAQIHDPIGALLLGAVAYLDECANPATRQILLIDAPSFLGHGRWRAIGLKHGLGLIEAVLTAGMEAGVIKAVPPRPLAHILMGALDEATLYIADAETPVAARDEVMPTVQLVIESLRA